MAATGMVKITKYLLRQEMTASAFFKKHNILEKTRSLQVAF